MPPSDEERPERPRGESAAGGRRDGADRPARPEYKVYRSRRGLLSRFRKPDVSGLRERMRRQRPDRPRGEKAPRTGWRRWARWALIAAGAWIALSIILFAISAQIQKGKLNDAAADELGTSFPLLVAAGQTILVMGSDARPEGTAATGLSEGERDPRCLRRAAEGDPPGDGCPGFRADTLMLVRAGGGAFEKLSIPRDTFADIPGVGAGKINGAYAAGGAALQIETVEKFLGINVDHAVILDFEGFADFIDAIGGVEVDLKQRVKARVDGGANQGGVSLKLDRGEHTLNGQEALALARVRQNLRNPNETDIARAARQQTILSGIKSRLTSPWRLPINFIRGPLIGWQAPRAMVSDMGALTMPQLALASAIGGDSKTRVLQPSSDGPGGSLIVPTSECERAVEKFLGKEGPETPVCSSAG